MHIFRKHSLFFLSFILFIILLISFYSNKTIIDTNLSLVINPIQTFYIFLSGWSNILYLGTSNLPVIAYIFPFGFLYYILSFLFSMHIVQALIYAIVLVSCFVSFTLFARQELKSKSSLIFVGSLFYALNMYTLLTLGTTSFLFPYAVLPLQLFFLRKIMTCSHYGKYVIGFSIATLVMSGVNPPLVGISLIVIFFFFFHILVSERLWKVFPKIIISLIVTSIVTVAVNVYWIFGDVIYYSNLSKNAFAAVLSEPLSMQNSQSTFLNVFRTLGLWSFGGGWAGKPYYNYSPDYLSNPIFLVSLYLIPLVVFWGFMYFRSYLKQFLVVMILFVLSLLMIVGSNQGMFAPIYGWSYAHLPLFSMFRSSYKFTTVLVLCLSFFLSLFLTRLKNVRFQRVLAIALIFIIILNAFPFFTKRVFEKDKEIPDIPSYYYNAGNFFQKDKTAYKVFLLPQQYYAVYDWGFPAGNPEVVWNVPIVARQAGSALETSNSISLNLYQFLENKKYKQFNETLKKLNVKYIVERNDYNWEFYKNQSQPPSIIKKYLSPYQKVATFGKLDIYQVPKKYQSSEIVSRKITFQKFSPVKYRIYFHDVNLDDSFPLAFLQSFDPGWKLYPSDQVEDNWCQQKIKINSEITECTQGKGALNLTDLSYLWRKDYYASTHSTIYNYANLWNVNPKEYVNSLPQRSFRKNSDGSVDFALTLYYKPQLYIYYGLLISGIALVGCLIFLSSTLFRRNKT